MKAYNINAQVLSKLQEEVLNVPEGKSISITFNQFLTSLNSVPVSHYESSMEEKLARLSVTFFFTFFIKENIFNYYYVNFHIFDYFYSFYTYSYC